LVNQKLTQWFGLELVAPFSGIGSDAQDVIKLLRAKHPTWNLRQVLDQLIVAGGTTYFPRSNADFRK